MHDWKVPRRTCGCGVTLGAVSSQHLLDPVCLHCYPCACSVLQRQTRGTSANGAPASPAVLWLIVVPAASRCAGVEGLTGQGAAGGGSCQAGQSSGPPSMSCEAAVVEQGSESLRMHTLLLRVAGESPSVMQCDDQQCCDQQSLCTCTCRCCTAVQGGSAQLQRKMSVLDTVLPPRAMSR